MGKTRGKDRLFVSQAERISAGTSKSKTSLTLNSSKSRLLPLSHCSLSLLPFNAPFCSPQGHIFEITAIMPFLAKYQRNPVTGLPLAIKELTALHFTPAEVDDRGAGGTATNSKDDHALGTHAYQCPILAKTFTAHSHVVANKATGNVYDYAAVSELVLKPKRYVDLIDETKPFIPKEHLITLQDPRKEAETISIENFDFIRRKLEVPPSEGATAPAANGNVNASSLGGDGGRLLAALRGGEVAKAAGGAAATAARAAATAAAAAATVAPSTKATAKSASEAAATKEEEKEEKEEPARTTKAPAAAAREEFDGDALVSRDGGITWQRRWRDEQETEKASRSANVSGVGRYFQTQIRRPDSSADADEQRPVAKKAKHAIGSGFGDFAGW
ncbi:peptidyl-prolyl cis-trans isomerase [Pseudoscourfieldia marina]